MDNWLFFAIALFVVLDIALLFFVLWRHRQRRISAAARADFLAAWTRIAATTDARHAVLDADALLDRALSLRGFRGSLGKKMQAARTLFSDNDALWHAHKLRNRLAHELDVVVSPAQKKHALAAFWRGLRDLGAL